MERARGPLSGLAAAPVVLASGGRPPVGLPDTPWVPFDRQGFAAYRVAMIVFALWAVLALVSFTTRLAGRRAAHVALGLAATTPFIVHETWFTWPKLLTAALCLLALQEALDPDHAGRAGALLGLAYLVHPLALFSVPPLLLLFCLRSPSLRSPSRRPVRSLRRRAGRRPSPTSPRRCRSPASRTSARPWWIRRRRARAPPSRPPLRKRPIVM